MDNTKRKFLFGDTTIYEIFTRNSPAEVFNILENQDKLFAQRVTIGDVIETSYHSLYVVTFVYEDKIHFDGICLDMNAHGRVISHSSIEDLNGKRLDEKHL